MSELAFEVTYPHPPERVWKAITTSEAMAAWLMPNDFQPRVGHRFTFRTDPAPGFDGVVRCEVLELDEPRRLSFTWRGGPLDTVAIFELDRVADGTRLRFRQTGFAGFKAQFVRLVLKSGWPNMYHKRLPAVLARMRDDGTLAEAPGDDEGCQEHTRWRALTVIFAPIFKWRSGRKA